MSTAPASVSLFRPAAQVRAAGQRHGTTLKLRQPAEALLVAMFVAVAAGLAGLLFGGSYTRQIRVSGALLPRAGMIRITAMQSGIAAEVLVSEGEILRPGQALLRVVNDRVSRQGESAALSAAALLQAQRDSMLADAARQQQQAELRILTLRAQRQRLDAELQQADEQQSLQRQRVALARQSLERYQALQAQGYIAAVQLQDRQAELIDQQQQQAALQRLRLALQTQHASAMTELRMTQLQQERDAEVVRRTVTGIEQQTTENGTQREHMITAPRSGTVGAIAVRQGQALQAGQVVATLVPADATLEAVLFAPSAAAGVATVGMTVSLRYHAWPYRKYGQYRGRIREISPTTLNSEELAWSEGVSLAARVTEPLYRVRVALERQSVVVQGRAVRLKPGMSLDASIATDRRRLYEWVLEPLVIVRGRG